MHDFFQQIFQQFNQTTWLEWIGTLTGFMCVYLAAKQNILNWPISIISVLAYAFLFFESKLYGDAVLQLYFLFTAVYGWYYWIRKTKRDEKPIVAFSNRQMLYTVLIIFVLAGLLGIFLDHITDSDVPYADGFCTSVSFVAQFLMTRKVLQNWILWIFVDLCYIPLYFHKSLLLTAILYLAFAFIAWNGYHDWNRTYQKSK
ncbi:nicotinamide riboside transporter PnuC [Sphingobacterium sp. SRCM116780]|uniref:nicotinamide riboside transporter PnuC n=1 Tax=Sphingobacterium sp. SRCM116780 TaxID=2907623 RepID=UPI001F45CD0E|nr:nicotinamide riboside transporter PnuC [Sphingobacterium sp. SRCM116780]UIR55340.1 nicotinamide riboside transporter PnuC [Sphingobacterium sp. SRCM116780]